MGHFEPSRRSFPFILGFWGFIPIILAVWALISFHFSFFGCPLVGFFGYLGSLSRLLLMLLLDVEGLRRLSRPLDVATPLAPHVRDGQPRPTHVERCCRGVPRPGPRLTQGGVFGRSPTD